MGFIKLLFSLGVPLVASGILYRLLQYTLTLRNEISIVELLLFVAFGAIVYGISVIGIDHVTGGGIRKSTIWFMDNVRPKKQKIEPVSAISNGL